MLAYCWTFGKDPQKFCERSAIKYGVTSYDVTMDLQKKSLIEPAESYPHWLKIKLWKELGRLVQNS